MRGRNASESTSSQVPVAECKGVSARDLQTRSAEQPVISSDLAGNRGFQLIRKLPGLAGFAHTGKTLS